MNYQDINAETIDRWVKEGWEWGKAIDHDTFQAAIEGKWEIKLTPVKYVPHSWFGDLHGQKVLGLASGGGQKMPILTALGAKCTVLDYILTSSWKASAWLQSAKATISTLSKPT
ncbi:hypothetical protein LOB25_08655 [Lactobacillus delbrueckii subsp. bulgaricus]|nr:hypothetical protein [Lactobacillus delbrueckii]MCD5481630.1 hypothetical protein [Lactobacillus delbrueckii subsp. bulgaricus]